MSEQTRKVHVPKLTGPDDNVIDTEEIEEFDPDILIKQAVAEFGGEPSENISVKIYALDEGKYEWCFACTPADLPVNERIREEFGGGKYEARLYAGARIKRRLPFAIRQMLKKPEPVTPVPTNDAAAVVQGIGKLGEMIIAMSQGFSQQIATLHSQNSGSSQPFNPFEMQKNMIENMVAMKSLVSDGGGGSGAKELIEVFKSGIEVAKEVAGDGGGDDMLSFLGKGTEMITKIANAAAANPAAVPAVTHTPAATMPAKGQQAAAMLKTHVDNLVKQAKKGSPAPLYADLILDNVPAQVIQSFIADGNALEKLARINPEVTNHQQWFAELTNELRAAMAETDGGTETGSDDQTGEDAPTTATVESADSHSTGDPEGTGGGQSNT